MDRLYEHLTRLIPLNAAISVKALLLSQPRPHPFHPLVRSLKDNIQRVYARDVYAYIHPMYPFVACPIPSQDHNKTIIRIGFTSNLRTVLIGRYMKRTRTTYVYSITRASNKIKNLKNDSLLYIVRSN